jgi:hypothetical protein
LKQHHRHILLATATALVFAIGAHLGGAGDVLFTCDLRQPQTIAGCPSLAPTDLVSDLVGPGILSVSNVTFNRGVPMTVDSAQAAGKLIGGTGAGNVIGLDSGVILSTGFAKGISGILLASGDINNPVDSHPLGLPAGQAGDKAPSAPFTGPGCDPGYLECLAGFPTFDATVLEFDFVPDKNRVFLQYVFGSDEYNQFVNFSVGGKFFYDVFAFYINGVNCATIDGLPVSIQTINGGGPALGGLPISHGDLYTNNDIHAGKAPHATGMDGYTKVLTCQAPVVANATNHIKLAIADVNDRTQDSNVVVKSHSFTTTPPLTIIKKTNNTDNDLASAGFSCQSPPLGRPCVKVGETVVWTYLVKNGGVDPLVDTLTVSSVTDDQPVGPISCTPALPASLAPGGTIRCTASGTAVRDAQDHEYINVGKVTGSSTFIGDIVDTNPDRYFGAQPAIEIHTLTNQTDNNDNNEPGPSILVGSDVEWTYKVKNIGNVTLDGIVVSDGTKAVDCSLVSTIPPQPPKTSLLPGETMICLAKGPALAGPQPANIGTASGTVQVIDTNGTPHPLTVTASDPDHYFGADPQVSLVKMTNGSDNKKAPGVVVLANGTNTIRWTYFVKNIGNVELKSFHIEDPAGPVTCLPSAPLAIGATTALPCTLEVVALKDPQHASFGKATGVVTVVNTAGSPVDGSSPEASDDDYYLGADPHVKLVKMTNGTDNKTEPGVHVLANGTNTVRWTYLVENNGNVDLKSIKVKDPGTLPCLIDTLAIGAKTPLPCALESIVLKDQQQASTGKAAGVVTVVDKDGSSFDAPSPEASDDDFYFGADPQVSLVKMTNGSDNKTEPGVVVLANGTNTIRWTYFVKNEGNVALNRVEVKDPPAGVTCPPSATLAIGATTEVPCTLEVVALQGQQHASTGKATGVITVVNTAGSPVDASSPEAGDDDFYFGANPQVSLVKMTNGSDNKKAPGVVVLANGTNTIRWTYFVKNEGNVALKSVHVEDPEGFVTCPPIAELAIGATTAAPCTLEVVALKGKQHAGFGKAHGVINVVNTMGSLVDGFSPEASDDDYYVGADPHVKLVKMTNGSDNKTEPGVYVLANGTNMVRWTYLVENDGNVDIKSIKVKDPATLPCLIDKLTIGSKTTLPCALEGTAEKDQRHASVGTATGEFTVVDQNGVSFDTPSPEATDDDYYFGVDQQITVVKMTNGTDNNRSPGLLVRAGLPIHWTYEVKNTGNVPLANVQVVDAPEGPVTCPGLPNPLLVNATWPCARDVNALTDAQNSFATAGGTVAFTVVNKDGSSIQPAPSATARDDEYYFGADPKVSLVKKTNGVDSEKRPVPNVLVDDDVVWTYEVSNTGNVTLTNIVVIDDRIGTICVIASMEPHTDNKVAPCSAPTAKAGRGLYTNTGTVTATARVGPNVTEDVTDRKVAHYLGVKPEITLVKKTNGTDFGVAPGPTILAGSVVTWTYAVTNTGDVDLQNVTVKDDIEGPICTIATLLVRQNEECVRNAKAKPGPYVNKGTAETSVTIATTNGSRTVDVTSSKFNYYFGADPRIAIVKRTVTFRCAPSSTTRHDGHDEYDKDHSGRRGDDDDRSYTMGSSGDRARYGATKSDDQNTRGSDRYSDRDHRTDRDRGTDKDPEKDEDRDSGKGCSSAGMDHDSDHGNGSGKDHDSDKGSGSSKSYSYSSVKGYESGKGRDSGSDREYGRDHGSSGDHDDDRDHNVLTSTETDNNAGPGPLVKVGAPIAWTYTVTNTGNVPLSNIVVTDDKEGPGPICTIAFLAPGQTAPACTKTGTALPGQYENVGTATTTYGPVFVNGVSATVPVMARDLDHYFGARPAVAIVKKTNGTDNDAPGPRVLVGSRVTWTYEITNTGNLPLSDVRVVDDRLGVIWCPANTLPASPDPAASMTCSASGKAVRGQYMNTGTVTASSLFGSVAADDDDYYWGIEIKLPYYPPHDYNPFPYHPSYGGPVCK